MPIRSDDNEFIPPPRPNKMLGKPGPGEDHSAQYGENGPEDRSARMLSRDEDDEFIPPPRPNKVLGKPGTGEDRSP